MTVTQTTIPRRVLVTGATGAIGSTVCEHLLARGHHARGADMRAPGNFSTVAPTDFVQGDLAEKETCYRAMDGMDTVIHLAAYVDNGGLVDVLLRPNVISPYYICEAARELGVKRLILASSVQVIEGFGQPGRPIGVDEGLRPRNHYALTKAWGEIMGEMYAHTYGLAVINVRIGWLPRSLQQAHAIAASAYAQDIYLSFADAQRFFERCVESETPGPGEVITVFAGSKSVRSPHMDLEPARDLLGYEPEDVWPENMPFLLE